MQEHALPMLLDRVSHATTHLAKTTEDFTRVRCRHTDRDRTMICQFDDDEHCATAHPHCIAIR